MQFIYKHSVLGGTFDHFHLGHQKLIDTAFEQSEHVTIGLATPALYQHKFLANLIEDYSTRERTIKNYLNEKELANRTEIIPINDIYGTTLQEKNIEAIFATEENLLNVDLINDKRKEIGFTELKVVTVDYLKDENGAIITSERIRKGEINRSGFVYKNIFDKTLILPDDLRSSLQKPISQVAQNTKDVVKLLNKNSIVIAVGDIITDELKKAGIEPALSIIDFRTRREALASNFLGAQLIHLPGGRTGCRIVNKPGTINREAVIKINKAIDSYFSTEKSQVIVINGEEDLLALPAILLAPLGSIVLYGQFDQGVVINIITENLKQMMVKLVEQFD